MEHGEAPGVASLKDGQALFLAPLWSAVTCHRLGTKTPTARFPPRRRITVCSIWIFVDWNLAGFGSEAFRF